MRAGLCFCALLLAWPLTDALRINRDMATSEGRARPVVICTQVVNEMPYLLEWIEYHRLLGADEFVIYDAGSTDGLKELPALYRAQGKDYVKVKKALSSAEDQATTFTDCLNTHRDAAWVGIFDVDEFMVLPKGMWGWGGQPTFQSFLAQYEKDFDQVEFQALRYGPPEETNFHLRTTLKQLSMNLKQTDSAEINCKKLGFDAKYPTKRTELVWGLDGPCVQVGHLSSAHVMKTITGHHVRRGPSKFIRSDPVVNIAEQFSECDFHKGSVGRELREVAGWKLCSHGAGKSFVRPNRCSAYEIHKCNQTDLRSTTVPMEEARFNHYYLRSAEHACKKATEWNKPDPLIMHVATSNFFNFVEDPAAINAVPQETLQSELDKFVCKVQ